VSSRLAQRLKVETRDLHVQAERSAFMSRLLRGELSRTAYVALLRNLLAIYAELEPALRRHALHPAIAVLDLAPLARTEALVDDLAAFGAPDVATASIGIEPSCRLYVDRLRVIADTEPELLLAHAYVRYLGDLSGGQMLRGVVARNMQLPLGTGVAFYDFGDASTTTGLAAKFRDGLDAATVDDDAIVREAKAAFDRHRALFDELASRHDIAD
jgi:heme oxygenase (biliverdin-producing, ferredoxin)